MKLNPFLLTIILALSFHSLIAQDVKFKKISKEDLSSASCSYEPEAHAEYLFHSCIAKIEYHQRHERFEIVYTYHDRIKIYDQSALDLADRRIRYYTGSGKKDNDDLENLEAYTYNLVNGKEEKTKLEKDNIYEEEADKYRTYTKFAMPAVKPGSILEIKYSIRSSSIRQLRKFYLQQYYPVRNSVYETEIPEYFNYNPISNGFIPLDHSVEDYSDRIKFSNVETKYNGSWDVRTRKTSEIEFKKYVNKYSKVNMPSIKKEIHTSNIDNFRSSMTYELQSTQFPGGQITYYSKDWNDIAEELNNAGNFGGQIQGDYNEFNTLINNLKGRSEGEIVGTIYAHIRDTYSWDSYYSDRTSEGIKNLIKTGSGNSAEINLLLVNLLQKAGIQAYPIGMRNRYEGYLNVAYPSLVDLNYVIVAAVVDGGTILLDATDKALCPGMLPDRAINLKGVVFDGNVGKSIPIQNQNYAIESKVINLSFKADSLVGNVQQKLKRYLAYEVRKTLGDESSFLNLLKMTPGTTYNNVELSGFDSTCDDIALESSVAYGGFFKKIDEKIFLDYHLNEIVATNPFTSEERLFPIFYDSKLNQTKILKFEIPEGYFVESIPENLKISLPENKLSYLVQFKATESDISVTIRHSIKEPIINPELYAAIDPFYATVISKSKEKIILAKK